jgi:hypothetical protein
MSLWGRIGQALSNIGARLSGGEPEPYVEPEPVASPVYQDDFDEPAYGEGELYGDYLSGNLYDPNSDRVMSSEEVQDANLQSLIDDTNFRGEQLYGNSWEGGYQEVVMSNFMVGWVDEDVEFEERHQARENYLSYMDWGDLDEDNDFDWDAWREYYGVS